MDYFIFTLDPKYSTNRILCSLRPNITNTPDSIINNYLFLPEGLKRQGEGGHRLNGLFKHSYVIYSDRWMIIDDITSCIYNSEININTKNINVDNNIFFKKKLPLISIITIVFNSYNGIQDTIKSVLSIDYSNIEYIIIDGGSNDGTLDVINFYDDYIDYWVSESDNGISEAFNKSLSVANGEWILFLNSGDIFASNDILQKLLEYESQYNIITGFVKIKNKNKYIPNKILRNNDPYFQKAMIAHQGTLARKYLFTKYGPFSLNFKMRMDLEFWLRVLKNEKFKFVQTIVAEYDQYGYSSSNPILFNYEEIKGIIKHDTKNIPYWIFYKFRKICFHILNAVYRIYRH
ncbi:MAG: glycosyltransferase family 2 protein [bacterium]